MREMRRPWIALATVLAACGGSVAGTGDPATTPVATPLPTVPGVGVLPATIPATSPSAIEPLVVITRPLTADGDLAELVGDQVAGNRLLMIGDSIFAGAETRYGGELCAGLEPLGWAVEVAAEAGRFVEFGVSVVRRLVPEPSTGESDAADVDSTTSTEPVPAGDDDWDAAAVFLGSNYNGDQENYDTKMRTILDRLAPRPTLLFTVTEYRTNYAEVTEVIEGLVADYPNVTLIDWATAARTPGVLRPDGLHPNDAGEIVLVDLTAAALGEAPSGEADCIRSQFRDDSAISDGNGSPNTRGSSSGSTSRGSSSSGGSSSSTSGSSTSGGSSSTTSGNGSTDGGTTGSTTDEGTDGGTGTTDSTDTDGTTDGATDNGGTTDSGSTDGSTDTTDDGGSTDGSSTDTGGSGSTTDGGGTDGGTDGGTTDGSTGDTTGGATTDGSTTGGATTGGATTGGATTGGATTGGSVDPP